MYFGYIFCLVFWQSVSKLASFFVNKPSIALYETSKSGVKAEFCSKKYFYRPIHPKAVLSSSTLITCTFKCNSTFNETFWPWLRKYNMYNSLIWDFMIQILQIPYFAKPNFHILYLQIQYLVFQCIDQFFEVIH